MQERSLNMLEFGKMLEHLSAFAVSEAGKAACLAIRPRPEREWLRKQANLYDQIHTWRQYTEFKLRNFPELDGAINFLSRSGDFLDLDALWAVREVLSQAAEIEELITGRGNGRFNNSPQNAPETRWPDLLRLFLSRPRPAMSTQALLRCLNDDGLLDDNASPELALIRGEIRAIHQQCTRRVKEFARVHNIAQYLQEDFMTLSSDRYVLPVKTNFKGQLEGIIHDYSQTGETCYFEPLFLITLNNKLQELKQEEREEERKVLRYLSGLLRSEQEQLKNIYAFMVELDRELAKIALADRFCGRPLRFESEGEVRLLSARHPLLALMNFEQVVPVNIELPAAQRAMIISGGNAGGKTVSLKTLGLTALMALSAIPVPAAAGSDLPLWENVFAFIGDEQSLDEHVSTFTAQIEHLAAIWPQISKKSLVILDEFGAGTDPSQGSALAQAVVDEILRKGGYVLAATHFPAFKAYALSRDDVRAASVLFDEQTKRPLYTLVYDQVGASLALDVAKANGMPEEIIRQAEKYLLMEDEDASKLITRLNSLALKREAEIDQLKKEQLRFEAEKEKLWEKFEKEQRKLLKELDETRRRIVAEIQAEKIGRKQALRELSAVRRNLSDMAAAGEEAEQKEQENLFSALSPGDMAEYLPWSRKGVVESVDMKKERVRLDFNGVTIWAAFRDLRPVGQPANAVSQLKTKTGQVSSGRNIPTGAGQLEMRESPGLSIPLRVDLRGARAEEALHELEFQIDQAMLAGRDSLEIVHGRGTGALRREIHRFLANRPGIAHFYTANEDQGGDGVTIIELK
ncbi:MAG: Smr/MutS family protein [Desulfovibrionaceae bacterium]|nr:Smr/MutS family protein [Desulfovibrionaceae bacterium]